MSKINKKFRNGISSTLAAVTLTSCAASVPNQVLRNEIQFIDEKFGCSHDAQDLLDLIERNISLIPKEGIMIPDREYAECVRSQLYYLSRKRIMLVPVENHRYRIIEFW